ncbi:MAG: hypothetical protein WA655_22105 [Candidatus Korobacteraceae bacterium]
MQPATLSKETVTAPSLGHSRAIAAMVGLAAVLWFMLLSGWMKSVPGSVMVKRQNVLFNSDSSIWLDRMIGNEKSPEQMIHPLEIPLWRAPCRALQHLLGIFMPPEEAGILGARLLVALVHGLGVGFLALLVLRIGVKLPQCILLFIVYFLFTSNCTAALPEHFGISNGLLSIAFVGPILLTSTSATAIFLAVMLVLCGGTTITNALYPLAAIWQYCFKSMRARMAVVAAAIPVGLAVFLFLYLKSYTMHHFVGGYLTLRLIRDPFRACIYAIYTVVCPAVGPTPRIMREPGWDMVSYEPAHAVVRLSYYLGLQAVGAIAWASLLVKCVVNAIRDDSTRFYVWLPLGWVVFSILFHNMWGDELALYSPHWSWALMALVILGARELSLKFVTSVFVPIVVSQVYTLFMIEKALGTITR